MEVRQKKELASVRYAVSATIRALSLGKVPFQFIFNAARGQVLRSFIHVSSEYEGG